MEIFLAEIRYLRLLENPISDYEPGEVEKEFYSKDGKSSSPGTSEQPLRKGLLDPSILAVCFLDIGPYPCHDYIVPLMEKNGKGHLVKQEDLHEARNLLKSPGPLFERLDIDFTLYEALQNFDAEDLDEIVVDGMEDANEWQRRKVNAAVEKYLKRIEKIMKKF